MALVEVARLEAEAHEIHLGRTLLTILAAVFYALGWGAAMIVIGVWTVLTWSAAAMRLGWQDAFGRRRLRGAP